MLHAKVPSFLQCSDHLSEGPQRCTAPLPISSSDQREEQVSAKPTTPSGQRRSEGLQRWQELIEDLAHDLTDNVDVSD